ncbi:putative divalent heavy-metal cations transporter [Halanaeroarchaeum sp. HSR-CO]|uniref:ZIP family metal transporter n=1 Tax=Halanaeroarchaeum sp. HSR-CO TaxID=2866382 RepID=UPI00217CCA82|nr:ZIP family metal transporter [Halanaeroarchaeum sp. HSR-CO]UWG46826.1 putative divalent heavy-metal cations transporter [Halanaeroarchaeum sp. HSR-CO]
MNTLAWILLTTIGISLTAWVGVLVLFVRESLLDRLLLVLVALAAGSLIGGAFLHLLPRAIEEVGPEASLLPLFLWVIGGFCLFYVLEQFIHWHHHHGTTHDHEPFSYLVLVSDTLHNFIDGLVIAGAFLVDVPLGLVTTAAIALHEIPQEIGDFGVLVYGGFGRVRALVLNYLSQVSVVVGGVVGFVLGGIVTDVAPILLAFASGNFIYIASSDLIPEIKHEEDTGKAALYFAVFVLGIALMLGIKLLRHSVG